MRGMTAALAAACFGTFVCFTCSAAAAADKPCADPAAAEKAIDRVINWQQLHKAWQDYRQCDSTKSVADVYTDAILRLTVEWKNVDAFAGTMKDTPYRDFVYAHLRSPAAKDDREAVYSRAKASCPRGLDDFCAGIADVAMPAAEPAPVRQEMLKPIPMQPATPKK